MLADLQGSPRISQEAEEVRVGHEQDPLLWFLQQGMRKAGQAK